MLGKCDSILIGGGMIFTFYKALGYPIGGSLIEVRARVSSRGARACRREEQRPARLAVRRRFGGRPRARARRGDARGPGARSHRSERRDSDRVLARRRTLLTFQPTSSSGPPSVRAVACSLAPSGARAPSRARRRRANTHIKQNTK